MLSLQGHRHIQLAPPPPDPRDAVQCLRCVCGCVATAAGCRVGRVAVGWAGLNAPACLHAWHSEFHLDLTCELPWVPSLTVHVRLPCLLVPAPVLSTSCLSLLIPAYPSFCSCRRQLPEAPWRDEDSWHNNLICRPTECGAFDSWRWWCCVKGFLMHEQFDEQQQQDDSQQQQKTLTEAGTAAATAAAHVTCKP